MRLEMLSKKVATERKWIKCDYCGKKIAICDDNAVCKGVYVKCPKCKNESEIQV